MTVDVSAWFVASMDFELSCFSKNTGSCAGLVLGGVFFFFLEDGHCMQVSRWTGSRGGTALWTGREEWGGEPSFLLEEPGHGLPEEVVWEGVLSALLKYPARVSGRS